MGKVLQKVIISDSISLYIISFNEETSVLRFRTSLEPSYLQSEVVSIQQEGEILMVRTSLYHFSAGFIGKFLKENS